MSKETKELEKLDKQFNEVLDQRTKGLFKVEFDSAESINSLRKILKNKIPWTGGEALSLVSLTDKVTNQEIVMETVEVDEEGKSEPTKVNIFSLELDALHVQNLSYFLNKYVSEGATSAKSFIKAIVPVINASNKLQELDAQLREIQGEKDKVNVEGVNEKAPDAKEIQATVEETK